MKDLNTSRCEIEEVDRAMAQLFEKRMQIAKDIAAYKKANNLPIEDSNRERFLEEKNSVYLRDKELKPYYIEFLRKVIALSKQYQADQQ